LTTRSPLIASCNTVTSEAWCSWEARLALRVFQRGEQEIFRVPGIARFGAGSGVGQSDGMYISGDDRGLVGRDEVGTSNFEFRAEQLLETLQGLLM
jgi:hypothetical protein